MKELIKKIYSTELMIIVCSSIIAFIELFIMRAMDCRIGVNIIIINTLIEVLVILVHMTKKYVIDVYRRELED